MPQAAAYDLSKEDERQKLFEAYPRVDILINNMGIWQHFIDVNFYSGNALAKFYLPEMLSTDFGRIIFIASEEAIMPSGEMPKYSLTKTMNLSLAKSLSKLTK